MERLCVNYSCMPLALVGMYMYSYVYFDIHG